MRVSVSDLLQSIPLPITRREVNIHAAVMLPAPGDEPASSPDAEGNCWITVLCCCRQGLGSRVVPLDGPAQWQDSCLRENHPGKLLPVLPQYQISSWLGENAQRDQLDGCSAGGSTARTKLTVHCQQTCQFLFSKHRLVHRAVMQQEGSLNQRCAVGWGGVPRGCSPCQSAGSRDLLWGTRAFRNPP